MPTCDWGLFSSMPLLFTRRLAGSNGRYFCLLDLFVPTRFGGSLRHQQAVQVVVCQARGKQPEDNSSSLNQPKPGKHQPSGKAGQQSKKAIDGADQPKAAKVQQAKPINEQPVQKKAGSKNNNKSKTKKKIENFESSYTGDSFWYDGLFPPEFFVGPQDYRDEYADDAWVEVEGDPWVFNAPEEAARPNPKTLPEEPVIPRWMAVPLRLGRSPQRRYLQKSEVFRSLYRRRPKVILRANGLRPSALLRRRKVTRTVPPAPSPLVPPGGPKPRRKLFATGDEDLAAESSERPASELIAARANAGPADAGAVPPALQGPCRMFVLWDLDNKYPEVLDHEALIAKLRSELGRFGSVREMHSFCNYHTLKYVPRVWDMAMETGMEHPLDGLIDEPLRCPLCGYRAKDEDKLQKHFKQLHQREHKKRLSHKPDKYRKTDKHDRFQSAIRQVLPKRRGFDLEGILRKLNVSVTPVPMGPQKADVALQKKAKELLVRVKAPEPNQAIGRLRPSGELPETEKSRLAFMPVTAAPPHELPAEAAASDGPGSELSPAGRPAPAKERERPVLVLISDDSGFEPLLKLFQSEGWGVITVSERLYKNADAQLRWRHVVNI